MEPHKHHRPARWFALLTGFGMLLLLSACTSESGQPALDTQELNTAISQSDTQNGPLALPEDARKPWESLDARGYVIAATDSAWLSAPAGGSGRGTSAINADSEFVAGAQFDSFDGAVVIDGLAAQFTAPAEGRCSAIYRIPLQGVQPGAASVDVNLRLNSNSGELSQCWVGIAEWGQRAWEWKLAPEGQTRFSLAGRVDAGADYINDLGNLMLAVVAYDGAAFDLVGLGVNTLQTADGTAPPVPTGLSATPVAGGLELQWNSVIAADLAGYRVYYSKTTFTGTGGASVRQVPYLQGSTRHLLSGLSGNNFVRVSAIDISGNESALSDIVSASALAGSTPNLEVTTSISSGLFGSAATLTASGATLYDIDADGDGIFEITGDLAGVATIDTNQTGIIRPAVRASDGSAVAHGAVSLIIAANLPPVAVLDASSNQIRLWGDTPGTVTLDAGGTTDEDLGSLQFAFDGDGNGSFGANQSADSLSFDYVKRGGYLAAVRVTDSAGLVGYASSFVEVRLFSGFFGSLVSPTSSANEFSAEIISGLPSLAYNETNMGPKLFYARARDAEGRNWREAFAIDLTQGAGPFPSLAEIKGNPAVAYFDFSTSSLKYIRCTSSSGTLQSSWSNPPVVIEGPMFNLVQNSIMLTEINGQPAIVYGNGADDKIYYVRATGAAGTGDFAADWTMTAVEIDTGAGAAHPSLANVDGNPAIAYYKNSDILYKRSISSTGEQATDWSAVPFSVVGMLDAIPDTPSLKVVNGNPAVSFINPMDNRVYFVRALNSTGATQADWDVPVILPAIQGPFFTDLDVVDGRPAVVCFGNFVGGSGPMFCRAKDADGATWDRFFPANTNPAISIDLVRPLLLNGPDGPGIMARRSGNLPIYFPADFQ